MLICWWINLMIWMYFALSTDTSTGKASLLALTQHVKIFSIQAFAEVEKSCFFSDLKPVVFMGSCSRNYEILAQMKVCYFPVWILQSMDPQERRTCWLTNVDILWVLFPGEVETKGSCKGRHRREEVLWVKWFLHRHFLKRCITEEPKASFSKD